MSKVAPDALTLTAEELLMEPVVLRARVPALMVVAPVYRFVPVRVSVPAPFSVKEPPDPEIAPATVVPPLLSVRFFPPSTTEDPDAELREAIVRPEAVIPEMSKVAPDALTLTAEELLMEPVVLRARVPALIVVAPV